MVSTDEAYRVVTFRQRWSYYNKGERAGFRATLAEALIQRGIAAPEPAPAPTAPSMPARKEKA